jgi:hypothetical protein
MKFILDLHIYEIHASIKHKIEQIDYMYKGNNGLWHFLFTSKVIDVLKNISSFCGSKNYHRKKQPTLYDYSYV